MHLFSARYITIFDGKNYIMTKDGYTFSNSHSKTKLGEKWRCTSTSLCNSRLYINEGKITKIFNNHTHTPPNYRLTSDGTYVRIRKTWFIFFCYFLFYYYLLNITIQYNIYKYFYIFFFTLNIISMNLIYFLTWTIILLY